MSNDTESRLRDFVAWVRYREKAGLPLDRETLELVANGVEQYLQGGKPWPKKAGNKSKPDLWWRCYYYCDYSGEYPEAYATRRHTVEGGVYEAVGLRLNLSPKTVESHARKGAKLAKTPEGKREFLAWLAKYKGATFVAHIPKGAKPPAWLKISEQSDPE